MQGRSKPYGSQHTQQQSGGSALPTFYTTMPFRDYQAGRMNPGAQNSADYVILSQH